MEALQPALEALMTGASAFSSTVIAFGAGVVPWHRKRAQGRVASASRRWVGPYVLLERIAAGGMGEVYRARRGQGGPLCAIKLLAAPAAARRRLQFEREVRLGEQLRHPNTVPVHDHGETPDGTLWFAMDLVEGISLEALVEQSGAQPAWRVIRILLDLAAALAEVHELGFVHRDIKPSNILSSRDLDGGRGVRLVDFGLVKDLSEPRASAYSDSVVGTPLYLAPESITLPDAVDGRTDLYGLGAVAHFLLSGAPPFTGKNVVEVCTQHLFSPATPLRELVGDAVSSELDAVVRACLAKDPAQRPASARELIRRLRLCPEHESVARPRPTLHASRGACGLDA